MDEPSLVNSKVAHVEDTQLTASLSQPDHQTEASASPHRNEHRNTFTFPTLALDGSLPDLTEATSKHRYSPTPPAALSSLGAKRNMADMDNSSETSLGSGYDMIDDISEISNDDHETASLVSTEREEDGQMTPEDSVVDLREEQNDDENTAVSDSQVVQENQLLDSYMSEQLETPRQSTIYNLSSVTRVPQSLQSSIDGARHVLFISDEPIEIGEISDICLRIASCLVPADEAVTDSRLVNLPLTQTRIASSSNLLVSVGGVELLVETCTGLETSMKLRKTDFVVYYRNKPDPLGNHFGKVRRTLHKAEVPIIYVLAPGLSADDSKEVVSPRDILLSYSELFQEDDTELREDIQWLLLEPKPEEKAKPFSIWDYIPLDGFYNDSGKFTWQELVIRMLPLLVAVLAALLVRTSHVFDLIDGPSPFSKPGVNLRRVEFRSAMVKLNFSSEAMKVVNIDHLLPYPIEVGSSRQLPNEIPYQGLEPNHILVSLPRRAEGWAFSPSHQFPSVASTKVSRSGPIDFNVTSVINGIYDITIPADEAYGVVTVNITTKHPRLVVPIEHDFGNRLLKRKTYEKHTMELTKAVNKDVMVARKNVKSLSDKIGLEWTAGATATKNVTSELAIYIARDLQILANTAISVIGKAAAASNETAATLKKEFVLLQKELTVVRKDLIKLTKDVQKSVMDTAQSAKALIPSMETLKTPLVRSKERAGRFGKLLAKRVQEKKEKREKKSSAGKELGTMLKGIFKSSSASSSATSDDLFDIKKAKRVNCIPNHNKPSALSSDIEASVTSKYPKMKTQLEEVRARATEAWAKAEKKAAKAEAKLARKESRKQKKAGKGVFGMR